LIEKAQQILSLISGQPEKCEPVAARAPRIKEIVERISPHIERHTSRVCPSCSTKCCVNRHAYYTLDDLIYQYALGRRPEVQELHPSIHGEPCQFLLDSGCILERHLRPLGCTWHFCDDLTVSMQKDAHDAYVKFSDDFDRLFLMWLGLTGTFRSIFREVTGWELDETLSAEVTYGLTFPWARV
jgi:hypothetical protein